MAAGGATGSRFRARAGALTLLYVAGSLNREQLLELLEAACSGEMPPIPTDDEIAAEEELEDEGEDYEDEDEELEEDEDDEDPQRPILRTLPPVLLRSQGLLGPSSPALQVTSKGDVFLFVAATIESWLRNCPDGPLELGPRGALALAPLVCSWSATITHALAAGPLTLEELDRAVDLPEVAATAAHVEALEQSGQVEALTSSGETRYALTEWGCEGIIPIAAAVRFECRYPEDDVLPPDVFDAEAGFQMALPLVRLPADIRGACRLGVRIPDEKPLLAGATVEVDGGRITASSALLDEDPETWATGTPLDWCETVIDPTTARVETGGDTELAEALLLALHEAMFGDLINS